MTLTDWLLLLSGLFAAISVGLSISALLMTREFERMERRHKHHG